MALYERNVKHDLIADGVRAVILAAIVIGWIEFDKYLEVPTVEVTADTKCVRVINHRNGDGYQCHDVNVVLRRYKVSVVQPVIAIEAEEPKVQQKQVQAPPAPAPAPAPTPEQKQKQKPDAKPATAKK